MDMIKPVTLTAREAAQYIGISYWLLLEMVKKHEIPHIECGSRKLFRKAALDQWMDQQEKKTIDTQVQENSEYGKLRKIY